MSLQYTKSATVQTVTLGSSYTAGSGTMTLTAGNGAYLPSSGDFWLSYNDGAGTIRIFKVTARSTDTLTVTAVSGEGAGDGNIASGQTLRWALSVDALDQLKADIKASTGLVLLQTQTASSSATLDFASSITSTYDTYLFEFIKVVPATNSVDPYIRVSTDGGSTYVSTATYRWWNFGYSSGGSGVGGATGATQIKLNGGTAVSNSANYGFSGFMYLYAPGNSSAFKQIQGQFTYNGSDGLQSHGAYDATTAVNAIRFLFSSGNIASGTIRCYGVAKT